MDSEKYSLRQRQKRKHILGRIVETQGYASDNSTESVQNINLTKGAVSNCGKTKAKAAPLSKYRRKTANARERTRMREINSAFETLRHCVPPCVTNEDSGSTNEKLTKITTLRLAMKYISILSDALLNPEEADYDFLYDCELYRQRERTPVESPNDLEPKEQCEKLEKLNPSKKTPSKVGPNRKTSSSKRSVKKQKSEPVEMASPSPIAPTCQASPASNASSAYASLSMSDSSASPTSNSSCQFESNRLNHDHGRARHRHSMSDLSNLMLESDGESLNLSDRCLSPLHTKHKQLMDSGDPYQVPTHDMQTLENPLELSLRLMDPTADSIALSSGDVVASPSTCFSPLMSLEPFNAFDLFHSDFNEQATLDLFLA